MTALEDARLRAEAEFKTTLLWIVDATRHFGVDEVGRTFRLAAELKSTFPSIIGIGIGGDEAHGPSAQFASVYAEAKATGLRLTAYAGESTKIVNGPAEIRAAIEIGAERIGHVLAAEHDDELFQLLAEQQLPLELSVTSSFCTGCCSSLKQHPLPKFLEAGAMIALNSDDPAMFHSNLSQEYVLVQGTFRLSLEQMRQLALDSVNAKLHAARAQGRLAQAGGRIQSLIAAREVLFKKPIPKPCMEACARQLFLFSSINAHFPSFAASKYCITDLGCDLRDGKS